VRHARVLVIHAVRCLQLLENGGAAERSAAASVVDRDGALSSRFGIGGGHGRTGMKDVHSPLGWPQRDASRARRSAEPQ
jgi:hypothetical protein